MEKEGQGQRQRGDLKEVGLGYEKTSGHSDTKGQQFEVALCCLVFLRALRLASDFFLLSNIKDVAGKFDDVVLFYRLRRDDRKYAALLVQAKHRKNPAEKRLTASNPFKLRDYLSLPAEIRNLRENPVTVEGETVEVRKVSAALYSNAGCDFRGVADDVTGLPEAQHLRAFLDSGGRLLRISAAQRLGLHQDFADCLTLCVEQMDAETADGHLDKELGDLLGLTSPDDAKHLRKILRKGVKLWWSERGAGRCLTAESREWKAVLEEQVARLNGLLPLPELSFTREALAKARSVVAHRRSLVTVADRCQATVTRVRLVRALGGSCLVLEAGSLAQRFKEKRWGEISTVWGTTFCPTLAVDLSSSSLEESSNLLRYLLTFVSGQDGRRLIVIAREESVDKAEWTTWSVLEAESTWSVLDAKTRQQLLSVKVNLQGHHVALRDVVGDGDSCAAVMNDELIITLCDSAAGVVMQLGAATSPPSLGSYVQQCLLRTAYGEINYEALRYSPTLIFSKKSFSPVIKNHTTFKNLYLWQLKRMNHVARTKLVEGVSDEWEMRKECCRLLVRGVCEEDGLERKTTEFLPSTWLSDDKVLVVEGVAGVGKSTFVTTMSHRVKERFPESWVLRFDLAKHTAFIKGRDFGDAGDVTAFLLRGLPRDQQRQQRHLLAHSLSATGNVFLFLDAFDEISPDYADECCRLMKGVVSRTRFRQMVVTTRSANREQVEAALGRKAFRLPEFSEEEQVLFLERFSLSKTNAVDKTKVSSLVEAAGPVLQVPLLCRMAAEVLLDGGDQDLLKYKQPWTKVLLYKRFVDQTFTDRLTEKLDHPLSLLEEKLLRTQEKEHLRRLQALAVRKLMPEDQLSNLDLASELPEENLGLVFSDGESVDLQHQTFAEFFLGRWLANNWTKCDRERLRKLLLQKGYEFVTATLIWSLFERSELHKAVARGLEVKQPSPGTADTAGLSALHVAAMTQGSQVLLLVAADEKDLQGKDKVLGGTPLEYAERFRNWRFLETLAGRGKPLKGLTFLKDQDASKEALIEVVDQHLTGLFKLILGRYKGLLNIRVDNIGNTLLHRAAACKSTNVLEHLIENRSFEVDAVNDDGVTPLHLSAELGHEAAVRLLVEKKADLTKTDRYGDTALMVAAYFGHEKVVQLFLEKGADPGVRDGNGCTALLMAAQEGREKVVKVLLERDVDVNTKDDDGDAPLTLAAEGGHLEVLRLLLEKGADPSLRNGEGETALKIAQGRGHLEVVQLLQEASRS